MSTPMHSTDAAHQGTVHLPEPTPWPFLMALGVTLLLGSLVLTQIVGILGVILTVAGAIGWFRDVLPHERHEEVPVVSDNIQIESIRGRVARIEVNETHRAQLPLRTFPISSGILGGIAGGIAMVIPAEVYGLLRYHSLWYVVNLLGGGGAGAWTNPTEAQLTHFDLHAFITANVIQGATTLLVGILYGAMLPIWPRRPILLGGILAPVIWTGFLYTILALLNPFLAQRIDWFSFALSQVFFGVVAGYVVSRRGRLQHLAQVPLAVRLGVETPGLHGETEQGKGSGQ